jgi:hypothetical protein
VTETGTTCSTDILGLVICLRAPLLDSDSDDLRKPLLDSDSDDLRAPLLDSDSDDAPLLDSDSDNVFGDVGAFNAALADELEEEWLFEGTCVPRRDGGTVLDADDLAATALGDLFLRLFKKCM